MYDYKRQLAARRVELGEAAQGSESRHQAHAHRDPRRHKRSKATITGAFVCLFLPLYFSLLFICLEFLTLPNILIIII